MPILCEDRTTIKDHEEGWVFEKVENYESLVDFDCGNTDLNDFIRSDARLHKDELIAQTYCLKFIDQGRILAPVAFLSLNNDSIQLGTRQKKDIPENLRSYKHMPAVKIGRLGVRIDMWRKDMGTLMLNNVRLLITTGNRTGCRFLTANVEPENISFYLKNDFKKLNDKLDSGKYTVYSDLKRFQMS